MRSKLPMALVALLFASAALAYVIPAYSILRRLVERRDDLRLNTLKVTGSISFSGEAAREAAPVLGASGERDVIADGTISLKLPGRCRLDVSTPEEKRIAVASANGKRRAEGGELPSLTQAMTQICP